MTPPVHYFTRRVGHDTDELYAYTADGMLARQLPQSRQWEAIPGPDWATIRAELTHPERTAPVERAD